MTITESLVEFFLGATLHHSLNHEVVNGSWDEKAMLPVFVIIGLAHIGHLFELTFELEFAVTQSSVHCDDLAVTHVTHHSSLCDGIASNRHDDIDVHHFTRTGIAEVLGRNPDDLATSCALEG